ncbi:MAG: hypothetical protein KR126chlam4_00561 [Candidatus Anoxychlamydiales bacterium]|uniref:Uncharacterized protein n=1 Tax=marine sediment metagenome TaxID=412755 RepID=A0A0F9GUJ5_9ZZZZ|nr:hypothetical protein [Candidatus Anoxychlamydiales bacterium]NGX40730.1 hypothetical protein [Candidatus Anoxychlamydiales bacterium]HEU64089.1 hypothetical protein [Chlamydiota bacterium]
MVKPVHGNDRKNQDFLPVALAESTGEAKIKVTIKVPNENRTVCCKGTINVTNAVDPSNPSFSQVDPITTIFRTFSQMKNCRCTFVQRQFIDPNDSRIE